MFVDIISNVFDNTYQIFDKREKRAFLLPILLILSPISETQYYD